jgi:hypothetical protein
LTLAPVLVLLGACWRGGEPPPEEPKPHPQVETLCAEFAFKGLMSGAVVVNGSSAAPGFDIANGEAERDAEQAEGLAHTDMLGAAKLFYSCATRFRSVPDTDPLRDTAMVNAVSCYENMMYAYAMAGRLSTEGKAELERSAKADPRMAPELRRMLADLPHDCAVRR